MAISYVINKSINRSIEFKGIKAQYIIYLALGFVGLLLLFAILFIVGLNLYFCLAIVLPGGIFLYVTVHRLSHKYGEHGLLKKTANSRLPQSVKTSSRKLFIELNMAPHEEIKKHR